MVELWGGPLDGHRHRRSLVEIKVPLPRPATVVDHLPDFPRQGFYRLAHHVSRRHLPCGVTSSWTRMIYRWIEPTNGGQHGTE